MFGASVKALHAVSIASFAVFAAFGTASAAQAGEPFLANVAHRLLQGEPLRIVAFGSSSTEGIGASSPLAAYPEMLERDLRAILPKEKVAVLNRGIGGQDADDMMERIDQDAIARQPDLVIWQTGSNDPLRGVPIDRFKDETREALLRLREAGVDVMLLEPQWCAVFERMPGAIAYRDAVREVGAELDAPVIRRSSLMKAWLRARLVTYDQMFARDGLHMRDRGYALLARDIAEEIMRDADYAPPKRREPASLDALPPPNSEPAHVSTVPAS